MSKSEVKSVKNDLTDLFLAGKLAKGGGIVFVASFFAKIIGLAFNITLGQYLGPADYGLFALGLSVVNFFKSLGNLGLKQGVVRFSSIYRQKGDIARLKGTVLNSLLLSFCFTALLSLGLFWGANLIATRIFQKPNLQLVFKAFSIGLPFLSISRVLAGTLQSFERITYQQVLIKVIQPLFKLIFVIIAIFAGLRLFAISFSWSLAMVVVAVVGLFFVLKVFPDLFSKISPKFNSKKLLKFSIPTFLSGFAYLIMNSSDRLILGFLRTSGEVGIYQAASRVSIVLTFALTAFIPIFMPLVAKSDERNDSQRISKIYRLIIRWILLVTVPIFFTVIFLSNTFLGFFGESFKTGALTLRILAGGYFFNAITGPVGKLIEMIGRPKINMVGTIILALVNVTLNIILIPKFGVIGAAIATSSSMILVFSSLILYVYFYTDISTYSLSSLKPLYFASIIFPLGFIVLKIAQLLSLPQSTIFATGAGLAIYIFLFFQLDLRELDKELFFGFLRKLKNFLKRK